MPFRFLVSNLANHMCRTRSYGIRSISTDIDGYWTGFNFQIERISSIRIYNYNIRSIYLMSEFL